MCNVVSIKRNRQTLKIVPLGWRDVQCCLNKTKQTNPKNSSSRVERRAILSDRLCSSLLSTFRHFKQGKVHRKSEKKKCKITQHGWNMVLHFVIYKYHPGGILMINVVKT